MELVEGLFGARFMPHGACYLWRPDILWLNVGSDAFITLAYYSIPIALLTFARRRPDVRFGWLFWMFSAFIFLCGTTHLVGIWTVWSGAYGVDGLVKLATAGVSVATAAALWPVIPRVLELPSPAEIAASNRKLRREIDERERIEAKLRDVQGQLEDRVRQRTAALETANAALRREVAERERAEEQLERSNRELEEFAHIVSHDLKAPLRGIVSLASWINEDCCEVLPQPSRDHLQLLARRARRMSELIDGILRYSRISRSEAGREWLASREVVREVVDFLAPPASVRIRIESPLPRVFYDRTQLLQVFQNLIGNAVQHLGKPEGEVVVCGKERDGDLEFAVRDDGVGIEERHFARIFRIFQSLDPEIESSGIGLAIVKKIVESHGGEVSVESKLGSGTTFRFTVPRAPEEGAALSGAQPG